MLGGPAAWFVSLTVSYFAVHEVCRHQTAIAPRIVSVIAFAVAVAAAIGGRGIWTQVAAVAHREGDRPVERTRFLAQIGVLGGTVFSLIILLQVVATLLLPSCRERPRTPYPHAGQEQHGKRCVRRRDEDGPDPVAQSR